MIIKDVIARFRCLHCGNVWYGGVDENPNFCHACGNGLPEKEKEELFPSKYEISAKQLEEEIYVKLGKINGYATLK